MYIYNLLYYLYIKCLTFLENKKREGYFLDFLAFLRIALVLFFLCRLVLVVVKCANEELENV